MFVRWQSYKHRHREQPKWLLGQPEWLYPKDKKKEMSKTVFTEVYWQVILVKSVRVDGKPRHRHIAVLNSILESSLKDPDQRRWFWKGVLEKLLTLGNRVLADDYDKIITSIAKKVQGPIPTKAEMVQMDQERAAKLEALWAEFRQKHGEK